MPRKQTKRKPSEIPCMVDGCNRVPTDKCHIKSKGSGGSMDDSNIVYMCREHHTEQHKIGWIKFFEKYSAVKRILTVKGWRVENIFGVQKLVRV